MATINRIKLDEDVYEWELNGNPVMFNPFQKGVESCGNLNGSFDIQSSEGRVYTIHIDNHIIRTIVLNHGDLSTEVTEITLQDHWLDLFEVHLISTVEDMLSDNWDDTILTVREYSKLKEKV